MVVVVVVVGSLECSCSFLAIQGPSFNVCLVFARSLSRSICASRPTSPSGVRCVAGCVHACMCWYGGVLATHDRFRDADPTTKGWHVQSGDELIRGNGHIDATPTGNPRFHSFRDAPPTSNGWHLVSGDELKKTEVKVDTTPLGSNIKNFKFRSNGKRRFNVVKKTQKPLMSYFE